MEYIINEINKEIARLQFGINLLMEAKEILEWEHAPIPTPNLSNLLRGPDGPRGVD